MQFDRKFRQMKITKYVHGRQKYESHSQKLAWPCVYPNEKAETRGDALMRIINDLVPDQFLDKNKLEYPSFCIKRYLHGANRDAYVRTTPCCMFDTGTNVMYVRTLDLIQIEILI